MQVDLDLSREIFYMINNGEYKKVHSFLTKLGNSNEKNLELLLFSQNQLIKVEIFFSHYQIALILTEDLHQKSSINSNAIYLLAALQKKLEIFSHLGKLEQSLELIIENEHSINQTIKIINYGDNNIEEKRILGEYRYTLGTIYQHHENVVESIFNFEDSIKIFKDINDEMGYALSLEQYADFYTTHGNPNKAMEMFKDALLICDKFQPNYISMWTYSHLAWLFFFLGNNDDTEKNAIKCLKIAEIIGDEHCLSWIYFIFSNLYHNKDDIENAIKFGLKQKKLRYKRGDILEICHSLNWVAFLYLLHHNEEMAIQLYKELLIYLKNITIPRWKSFFYSSYARFCENIGNEQEAIIYLNKAKESLKNTGDIENLGQALHFIIHISIKLKNIDYCMIILDDIKKLKDKNPTNITLQIMYELNKALIMELKPRIKDKIIAQLILKKIIDNNDINTPLYLDALIAYCNMLLYEIHFTHDDEIIIELEKKSDLILNYADSNINWNSLAHALLLKAKNPLYDLKIHKSLSFLTQAENIAEQKGLILLAKEISLQHDNLLDLVEELSENHEKNKILQNQININPESIYYSVPALKMEKVDIISKNIPKNIVIWASSGLNLYNYSFSKNDDKMNASFITNYLSAFNQFGKQALTSDATIDRIKHGEYTIVIRPIFEFNIAYIFKGESYSANQKIKELIDFISKNKNIMLNLKKAHETGLVPNLSTKTELDNKILEIFYT